MTLRLLLVGLGALALAACAEPPPPPATPPAPAAPPSPAAGKTVAQIRKEAAALGPLVKSGLVKELLAGAADLPAQPTRRLWHDAQKTRYWLDAEAQKLGEAERRALYPRDVDEELYYVARFGTPLAYARPLDLLGLDRDGLRGKKILDFGFGAPGQLRLLAALGVQAVGVEVDALSRALYTLPGDQGPIKGRFGQDGSVTLLYGAFPADPSLRRAVGGGYDLFISKNVLKRGYVHPERFAPLKQLVSLDVDDETFVRVLHEMLVPGGRALLYNICPPPAPPDKPYIPWADGRSPFAREVWEKGGFKIIAFDHDDTAATLEMARALGWDKEEGGMEFSATYTLAQRI
jgi:hypothetical protein